MSTLTTQVFGPPRTRGSYWNYYPITKSQEAATAKSQGKPVVLMFCAHGNVPCNVMMKSFRDMARAKKDEAVFCCVDVDKCKDIAEEYQVEALPTFVLIKQGKEYNKVVGAKVEELNNTIKANI